MAVVAKFLLLFVSIKIIIILREKVLNTGFSEVHLTEIFD